MQGVEKRGFGLSVYKMGRPTAHKDTLMMKRTHITGLMVGETVRCVVRMLVKGTLKGSKVLWEHIKELLGDLYGISAMGWVLTHLVLIYIYGTIQIYEGNEWILWIEIVYTSGALILLVERFWKDIRRIIR